MDTRDGTIHEMTREMAAAMDEETTKFMLPMSVLPTTRQLKKMKVGRNDLCPCGSGIKFKKCHLGKPVIG